MLYFATTNDYKFKEFCRLFGTYGIKLEQYNYDIPEILTYDMNDLARDKLVKAFGLLGRAVMVDASGLAMDALNGLPQGLNRQFWDVFKNQPCELAARLSNDRAHILVHLAFTDGRRLYTVEQRDPGTIALAPAGLVPFYIDQVFIPEGCSQTLGEMLPTERDKYSHRRGATEKTVKEIKANREFWKLVTKP